MTDRTPSADALLSAFLDGFHHDVAANTVDGEPHIALKELQAAKHGEGVVARRVWFPAAGGGQRRTSTTWVGPGHNRRTCCVE